MNNRFREMVIDALNRGEELPADWARELFPPDKREYELTYYGKEREEEILTDTMAVPLQAVRTFGGSADWQNKLIFGDNLQALKTLLRMKEEGELASEDGTRGVRLIYIDPPFGTGDQYGNGEGEIAYSAKIRGTQFIEFLRKRLILLRELLADDGSIYVRLDHHFGHYIKVIMDEVFGEQNFRNELVINRFKRQLRNLKQFNVGTDSLFFYSRGATYFFKEQLRERLCSFCGSEAEPAWIPMSSSERRNPPERRIQGKLLLPPRGRHWTFRQEVIDRMDHEGRIRINPEGSYFDLKGRRIEGIPEYLQTDETPIDSDWTDLKGYVRSARYPTENPEELLARAINASSKPGDLVLDAFAGSGTTIAVAEKLGRRWIGIDCGKLATYTMQKRLLHLKSGIGTGGRALTVRPFTLFNAGLYDFGTLRRLPWDDWRFFALQLFGCRDETHTIGRFKLDGKLKGSSVLVFNHHAHQGKRIDEETVRSIHLAIGKQVGKRFFIIAPRGVFDFQQDYLDIEGVRYYALRIPYSIINELHARAFTALRQPRDEGSINETVDAVGFDFIRPPEVAWKASNAKTHGTISHALLKIRTFESTTRIRGNDVAGGLDTFAMLMVDLDYDGDIFEMDEVRLAQDLKSSDWQLELPANALGVRIMVVFIDIFGNESRVVIPRDEFGLPALKVASTSQSRSKRKQHAAQL